MSPGKLGFHLVFLNEISHNREKSLSSVLVFSPVTPPSFVKLFEDIFGTPKGYKFSLTHAMKSPAFFSV